MSGRGRTRDGQAIQARVDRVTVSVRLHGRMPDTHPTHALVLTRTSRVILARSTGHNPRAMVEAHAMLATGEAHCADPESSLLSLCGAIEWPLALRTDNPDVGPERVDDLADLVLTWFGFGGALA